eukprot:scaffold1397_cov254-Pinguiococcus_pyrenoidosus.AAC.45
MQRYGTNRQAPCARAAARPHITVCAPVGCRRVSSEVPKGSAHQVRADRVSTRAAWARPAQSNDSVMAWEAYRPREGPQAERVDSLRLLFSPQLASEGLNGDGAAAEAKRGEAAAESELPPRLAAAKEELAALEKLSEDCSGLETRLEAALSRLSAVAAEKQRVSSKTSSLTKTCEALLAEQTAMEDKVKFLLEPLGFFRDVDRLAEVFGVDKEGGPRLQPSGPQFSDTMRRIDAALGFFDAHMHYRDAPAYRARMAHVQVAALELCRDAIQNLCANALRSAVYTSGVQAAATGRTADSAAEHQLEAWYPYSKFRALAPRLRELSLEFEIRAFPEAAAADEGDIKPAICPRAMEFLERAELEYVLVRKKLLSSGVRKELARLAIEGQGASAQGRAGGGAALLSLVRLGSSYLGRLLTLESQLFFDSFGPYASKLATLPPRRALAHLPLGSIEELKLPSIADEDGEEDASDQAGQFWYCLEEILGSLYSLARPLLVHCNDIDSLCALVETVREELDRRRHYARTHDLSDSAKLLTGEAGPLAWVLHRCAADAQERLSLVGRQHLLSEVAAYLPTDSDMDYPGILERFVEKANREGAGYENLDVFDTWYPPVGSLLRLLAQLYRAVETHVFEDLANAAVTACTKSLMSMRSTLMNHGKSAGDAEMFLVRHLLVLREQLSPFNIRLLHVERSLDFSTTAQALQEFMREGGLLSRRVLNMTAQNPLVNLLVEGRPRVKEDATDGKAALEKNLKEGCNNWIEIALNDLLGPLKDWLTKVSALAMEADEGGNSPKLSSAGIQRVRLLPSASPDRIKEIADVALAGAAKALPARLRQLHLYILNTSTQTVLFRPVQRRVSQALQDVTAIVQQLEAVDESGSQRWQEILSSLKALNTLVVTADVARFERSPAAAPSSSPPEPNPAPKVDPTPLAEPTPQVESTSKRASSPAGESTARSDPLPQSNADNEGEDEGEDEV